MIGERGADLVALGQFIRDRRQARGLTQAQLARQVGWLQERISLIENGKYGMPSLPGLVRLAEALQLPFHALLEAAGYKDVFSDGQDRFDAPDPALQYTLQRLLGITSLSLTEAMGEAADMVATALGAEKVDAFLYEPETSSLVALGTSNTPMGHREHRLGLNRLPIANGGAMVEVFETGESCLIREADEDSGISPGVVEQLGVRSVAAVALRVGSEIRGVLSAQSSFPDRFTEDDLSVLEAIARWVGVIAHRAELAEAQRQALLHEARRVTADDLIATLAHDLGNYLTPLKGRIDLMRRRFTREGRERDVSDLGEARRSIENIHQMISRLLDVTRLDQGLFTLDVQPVDLGGLVEQVVNDLRSGDGAITVRVKEGIHVDLDPVRFASVLLNLLNNATRHSPDGGDIEIEAVVQQRESGRWAVVSVRDHGVGIDPTDLPRIFDRFASGKGSTGLGIGLYLARGIVEAHGGTLEVDSKLGEGTEFRISLPL